MTMVDRLIELPAVPFRQYARSPRWLGIDLRHLGEERFDRWLAAASSAVISRGQAPGGYATCRAINGSPKARERGFDQRFERAFSGTNFEPPGANRTLDLPSHQPDNPLNLYPIVSVKFAVTTGLG
jgi:hypothetical protein